MRQIILKNKSAGNLNKWWSDFALKNFHNKTKCLIQQYNKYFMADIGQKIDGETTQGRKFYFFEKEIYD